DCLWIYNVCIVFCLFFFFFFFFQAEDGIRDRTVTGVQTCALPISIIINVPDGFVFDTNSPSPTVSSVKTSGAGNVPVAGSVTARSEERRVGKECRCGWAAEQ